MHQHTEQTTESSVKALWTDFDERIISR